MVTEFNHLGKSELEADDYERYRLAYPGSRGVENTWKFRIERFAEDLPNRLALVQGQRSLSYLDFNIQCNRLAHGLLDAGLKKGDRVAILGFNSIEWLVAFFGAAKIGAVPVNVNPRFNEEEVRYILEDADASAVFVEEPYAHLLRAIQGDIPSLKRTVVYALGKRPDRVLEGQTAWDDFLGGDTRNPNVEVFNDDFALLFYTGGTTGYPKGTVWDYEQRVKGLDLLLLNAFIPLLDKLAALPKETLKGFMGQFARPCVVGLATALLSSAPLRAFLKSRRGKLALLGLFARLVGNPKAAKLMHRINPYAPRMLPACPLFHGTALEGVLGHIGSQAGTVVLLPTPHPFDPKEFWEVIEKERVNMTAIVGDAFALPMLEALDLAARQGKTYDLSSLFAIASSGVRWSKHVKSRMLEHMPHVLLMDGMGSTEVSIGFMMLSSAKEGIQTAGAILPKYAKDLNRHAPYSCHVIDPETGEDIPPGSQKIGQLVYEGRMALGYWKCPSKTAKDFRHIAGKRLFFVGDEGTVDSTGSFRLIGRGGGYMINSGGEKVYSEEIEEVIKTHPKVYDAAVIGLPDERWGQAVTALVKMKDGVVFQEDELVSYCKQRMAGYKRPKGFFTVTRIPRLDSGKIDRPAAIDLARELAGLSKQA